MQSVLHILDSQCQADAHAKGTVVVDVDFGEEGAYDPETVSCSETRCILVPAVNAVVVLRAAKIVVSDKRKCNMRRRRKVY